MEYRRASTDARNKILQVRGLVVNHDRDVPKYRSQLLIVVCNTIGIFPTPTIVA